MSTSRNISQYFYFLGAALLLTLYFTVFILPGGGGQVLRTRKKVSPPEKPAPLLAANPHYDGYQTWEPDRWIIRREEIVKSSQNCEGFKESVNSQLRHRLAAGHNDEVICQELMELKQLRPDCIKELEELKESWCEDIDLGGYK